MPLPKEERYTLADALTWDESERIELICGVPYMMSPPVRVHQEILTALVLQIGNYLNGKKCRVYPAPFAVRLFEKKEDHPGNVDTLVEPDISVVCDPDKLDDIGCKGAPDLVIEILSPSTQRHDRVTKFNLYQEAGVREYWIVDPLSKTVQVYVLENGIFRAVESYAAEDVAEVRVLPGCTVTLSDVFQE
jgi:Uma2 family endonuclease